MADDADRASKDIERELDAVIAAARGDIKPGVQGEWSGRLIGGVCAPCRDRYGME